MTSNRLLSCLLGATILSSALLIGGQGHAAQTVKTFSPATSWAVSRIDPTNGSAAYCTLARRFTGNTVITFARNADGEGTIAVDFQQPLFSTEQTYRIGLQAGEEGATREFLTRPVTANALVLRSGQDPEFFSALAGSDELGVILNEKRYAFKVPDFTIGTSHLTNCLSGTPAAGIAPVAPASADNTALSGMRAELDALKRENANIVASLKEKSNAPVQVAQPLKPSRENNELMARLSQLENEKNSLVEKLQVEQGRQEQSVQGEADLKSALSEQRNLKSMLENERAERLNLEAALNEKTAEAEKRGEMRARIAQLEISNAELKSLRETLELERSKRIVAENALVEQRSASLEDQERLRAQVSELENKNKSLQETASEFEITKTRLEDTKSRMSEESARRTAAENALKDMQVSIAEREASLQRLEGQLDETRAKMAEAQSAQQQELTQQHGREIAQFNAQIAALRTDQEKAVNVLSDLQEKVSAETARRMAAERALEDMQKTAATRSQEMTSLQARLEEQKSKMNQAIASQEQELSDAHATEIARLNAQIEKLNAQASQLGEVSEKAASEAAQRAAAEQELRMAQQELRTKEQKLTALSEQKLDVQAEAQRRAETEKELEQARVALSQKATELTKLDQERKELLDSLEKERAQMANMRVSEQDNQKLRDLSGRLSQLENHNSDLVAELQVAKARTQRAEQEVLKKSNNNTEIDLKSREIAAQADADRRDLEEMLAAERERRKKLETAMSKDTSVDDRVREMDAQIAALMKKNSKLEAMLQSEQSKSGAQQVMVSPDTEAMDALHKQLSFLKKDNLMLADRLASVANEPQVISGKTIDVGPVSYDGDDQMANALAETKSSLASVLAERDEYRDLLQRERIRAEETGEDGTVVKKEGTNARIKLLEAERVDLVRQLEYERSRLEQIAAGKEAPPAMAGRDQSALEEKLARLEAEKEGLQKQLKVAQIDIIEARQEGYKTSGDSSEDVAELLRENKKLQMELANASQSRGGGSDTRVLETEIAALRAQNSVLSEEINKRLAAAPDRATIDNTIAQADFTARENVKGKVEKIQNRYAAVESENIRLARELQKERSKPKMQPIVENDQEMATTAPVIAQAPVQTAQPVMYAPKQPMPTPSNIPTMPVKPVMYTPQVDSGPSGQDIAAYLQRSGIALTSGFEKVGKVSNAQFSAFRWDTGVVYGTAEQQIVNDPANFDQEVQAYLAKTQQRCSGTYDQSFPPMTGNVSGQFATADVACIMPDGSGAGAAMVFFYKDGLFNAVAHEGDLGSFDQAMTTRDTLAQFMKGQL